MSPADPWFKGSAKIVTYKEKVVHMRLLDGKIKRVEHYELTKASLGSLVDLLVSLDLSPAL